MKSIFFPEWKNYSIILLVVTATIVLYGRIDFASSTYSQWDLSWYRAMASASPMLATDVPPPFAFRVLGPYVVGLLPVSDPIGFYTLSVILSVVLALLFYSFLRYSGLAPAVCLVSVTLFTLNRYWFGFTIWNYFQINDLLSMIYIVVLFWALLEDHWTVFGIMLLLGALTKEISMLMVPVAGAYLLEKGEIHTKWLKASVSILPALTVFTLLRIVIPAEGGATIKEALLDHAGKIFSLEILFRIFVNSFLPLSLIPIVFLDTTRRFFKARRYALVFLILVFLSTLFGQNNERLVAPAFVVVYALIGTVIQELKPGRMFLTLLIITTFLSSLYHFIATDPSASSDWKYLILAGPLLVVTSMAFVLRLLRDGAHREFRS